MNFIDSLTRTLVQNQSWHHLRNIPTHCANQLINTSLAPHKAELVKMAKSKYLWTFQCAWPFLSIISPQSPQSRRTLTQQHSHARHWRRCVTVLTEVGGLKSAPHTVAARITGHWLKDLYGQDCAITPLYSHLLNTVSYPHRLGLA